MTKWIWTDTCVDDVFYVGPFDSAEDAMADMVTNARLAGDGEPQAEEWIADLIEVVGSAIEADRNKDWSSFYGFQQWEIYALTEPSTPEDQDDVARIEREAEQRMRGHK